MTNFQQPLRNIGIIGRITLLEGARKQVFHVLMLFAVFLIFGSATLAKFDRHVQMKMLNDLCLFSVFLVSSIVAITLTVTGIPGEQEQKTVYPVIAKPVARWQFVCGKYAGAMGTVAIGMAVMAATFSFLQIFYMGHLDAAMFYVLPFLFLETAILAALALWLSTWASWPLAWFLSVLLCLLGNVKFPLYASLMEQRQNGFNRVVISGLYHLLPNLESFNFKDALVHHLTVPSAYLWQTAAYGICYTAALLTLASLTFARKEL
ncbi:MAG: ABC transporter permease subunit [Armatimonadota bacterium]|nr:ABC transporter permease subunit [Armatimonadota bacterium]